MDSRVVHLSTDCGARAARASRSRTQPSTQPSTPVLPHRDEPEAILAISFEGITEREQEAALAAFPGGKRFVLVH